MIDPIILSEMSIDEAKATFEHWLHKEPYTLLIIPGKHEAALLALKKADGMINSSSANFLSVRAVHAPVPEFIIPILQQLKVKPELKAIEWDKIVDYAVLSVSNSYNNIGGIAGNAEFMAYPGGQINKLIRHAQAFDILLA